MQYGQEKNNIFGENKPGCSSYKIEMKKNFGENKPGCSSYDCSHHFISQWVATFHLGGNPNLKFHLCGNPESLQKAKYPLPLALPNCPSLSLLLTLSNCSSSLPPYTLQVPLLACLPSQCQVTLPCSSRVSPLPPSPIPPRKVFTSKSTLTIAFHEQILVITETKSWHWVNSSLL